MGKAVKGVVSSAKNFVKNPTDINNIADIGMRTATGGLVGRETVNGFMGKNGATGGYDESGRPIRPGFQSLLGVDEATGKYNRFSLPEELQAKQIVGQEGMNQLKDRALATGPSAWAQMQTQAQGMEEAKALGDISKQGNSAMAQAQGQIARGGGLRSGVGAMMAMRNSQDQMLQKQNARRGGIQDRLQIAMQDDQTKNSLLQNLVGGDLQAQQYNIGNVLQEKRTKDAADMAAYGQDMEAWAAKQQGKAISNSKPSGFLSFLGM
jgi:hypothetical protein